jgi:hypothetical protein
MKTRRPKPSNAVTAVHWTVLDGWFRPVYRPSGWLTKHLTARVRGRSTGPSNPYCTVTARSPTTVLYNFKWFITHLWPWHTWRNFCFVSWWGWPVTMWQFCQVVTRYAQDSYSAQTWKFPSVVWFHQFMLWPMTGLTFCQHQVPLWHVTDKLFKIIQYTASYKPMGTTSIVKCQKTS